MALFNYATKEITLKIVYYGPGLSGKTTNIQNLHSVLNSENKGKLLSLSTESDRTLFFDFLPVELGKIKEFSIRFQLYTVPGQVRYNATRKVVLKGADAVVFVADSQREMRDQNIESFENMRDNLISNNINPDEISVVLQYNKRDLKNLLTIDELNADLNKNSVYNIVEAEAINGKGVKDTFQLITRLVLKDIARKHKIDIQPAPLQEEAKQEEKIVHIQMTEFESFQPEDEVKIIEPSSHLPEEELEVIEPQYELEERMKETSAFEKTYSEMEAESKTGYEIEKDVCEQPSRKETMEEKAPVISDDKIKAVASDVAKLNAMVLDIKSTVASLKEDMLEIKDNLSSIKANTASGEDKHIKELRKEMRDLHAFLGNISALFGDLKIKKRWFKF
jgi:hypothetical protein